MTKEKFKQYVSKSLRNKSTQSERGRKFTAAALEVIAEEIAESHDQLVGRAEVGIMHRKILAGYSEKLDSLIEVIMPHARSISIYSDGKMYADFTDRATGIKFLASLF